MLCFSSIDFDGRTDGCRGFSARFWKQLAPRGGQDDDEAFEQDSASGGGARVGDKDTESS